MAASGIVSRLEERSTMGATSKVRKCLAVYLLVDNLLSDSKMY